MKTDLEGKARELGVWQPADHTRAELTRIGWHVACVSGEFLIWHRFDTRTCALFGGGIDVSAQGVSREDALAWLNACGSEGGINDALARASIAAMIEGGSAQAAEEHEGAK